MVLMGFGQEADLDPSPVYRTDAAQRHRILSDRDVEEMGMDTAWRDYKINNMELLRCLENNEYI